MSLCAGHLVESERVLVSSVSALAFDGPRHGSILLRVLGMRALSRTAAAICIAVHERTGFARRPARRGVKNAIQSRERLRLETSQEWKRQRWIRPPQFSLEYSKRWSVRNRVREVARLDS